MRKAPTLGCHFENQFKFSTSSILCSTIASLDSYSDTRMERNVHRSDEDACGMKKTKFVRRMRLWIKVQQMSQWRGTCCTQTLWQTQPLWNHNSLTFTTTFLAQTCDKTPQDFFKNAVMKATDENRVMFSSHDFSKHCDKSSRKKSCDKSNENALLGMFQLN